MLNVKKLLTKIMNQQDDMIKIVHNVTLNSSGSVGSGRSCEIINTFVTNSIPSGYKLLAVTLRGTTNALFYCWYLDWTSTTNRVDYRVTNSGSSAASVSPTVNLICIKLGGYCVVFAMLSALPRGGVRYAERKENAHQNRKQNRKNGLRSCYKSRRGFVEQHKGRNNNIYQHILRTTERCSLPRIIIDSLRHGASYLCCSFDNNYRLQSKSVQRRYKWTFTLHTMDCDSQIIPERGWASC